MNKDRFLKRDSSVIFREESDIALLFHPDTGGVNTLNITGKFIWQRLDGKKTKTEILNELKSEFYAQDTQKLEADFDNFVKELFSRGLLDVSSNILMPPRDICFGLTSTCNLSCKHCFTRNVSVSEPDLSTEELLNVIDQLGDIGVKNINLFGGEPLCHPHFKQLVEHLNKYPINLSLNTNGTLINRQMARWLKEHKIIGATVSLDGSNQKIMDAIRGEGVFELTLRGIEALSAEGLSVLLSVTLNKINYQDVRAMTGLAKKISAQSIRFHHVFFAGNAACFSKELHLNEQEELQAINEVWQLKQEFGNFIHSASSYLCQREKLEAVKNYQPATDKLVIPACGAARNKCAIRPDGWVVPCEIIWEVKCDSLREKSLKAIWQDSKVLNSFRRPLEIDLNELPECKGCIYQYLCFIGHRCYPYYSLGGIKNRSLYCWLRKEKGFC